MINFGNLKIEGYCSIDNFEINLTTQRAVIIRGRNGSGKSSLLSAILWVLYGTHSKEGVKQVNTWKKLQPKDYKGTMVSLFFEKNGMYHQVIRCSNYKGEVRGAQGKNRLIYVIDNEEIQEKRKGEIQERIVKDLGLSHSLFLNSVMFGQGLKRLVQTSSSDKKDIFEEIFNLNYLTEARDKAKSKYQELLKNYQEVKSELNFSETQLEEFKNASNKVKDALEAFSRNQKELISQYTAPLKALQDKLMSAGSLEVMNREIEKLKIKKEKFKSRSQELKKDYENNLDQVDLSEPEKLEQFLDHLIELVMANPKQAKQELIVMKEQLLFIMNFQSIHGRVKEKLDDISSSLRQLENKLSEDERIREKIESLQHNIKQVKAQKMPETKDDYGPKISKLKKKIKTNSETLQRLEPLVENHKWLVDQPLGNKGIKSFIFESSLAELNNIMKEYSNILGFQIEFSIDLNSARKDFYTLIELEGNIVDYKELSGGQQQLVHLAMAFATHTLATASHGINLLFLDEVFENLDSENVDIVVSLIRKMSNNKSIYIITHKDSLPISNALVINLARKNGLTQFS